MDANHSWSLPLKVAPPNLRQSQTCTPKHLHGTNEPWMYFGKADFSSCIRMMNQDVIDLYGRVSDGAKVVVLPAG